MRRAVAYTADRWKGRSVLLKDPLALLSAEWLGEQFDLDVLVMIRHPAAFAGSLKEKGWTHPFQDFLDQPQLMDDYFTGDVEEVEAFADRKHDIVDQAAFLWKMLYSVVKRYRERHSDWVFLRHEDVARDPVQQFRQLYDRFGLSFTGEIRSQIESHSNPSGAPDTEDSIRRNSQSVVRNWTERLTRDEIERVRSRTEPIASEFYTEDDW